MHINILLYNIFLEISFSQSCTSTINCLRQTLHIPATYQKCPLWISADFLKNFHSLHYTTQILYFSFYSPPITILHSQPNLPSSSSSSKNIQPIIYHQNIFPKRSSLFASTSANFSDGDREAGF